MDGYDDRYATEPPTVSNSAFVYYYYNTNRENIELTHMFYFRRYFSVFGSALFHEDIVAERVGGLVVVRDISFASLSNTTLLPFHGSSHIAYVPQSGVILGLSKLARVARCLASRIQSQQQFTDDLLEAVTTHVTPLGAAVIVQATHIDAVTGAEGASQFTVAASGCFNGGDSHSMEEFETLLGLSASIPKFIQQDGDTITSDIDKPTGMSSSCAISAAEKAMREAVTTLIKNTHDTGDDSKVNKPQKFTVLQ